MSIFIAKITTILLHSANLQRVPALLRRLRLARARRDFLLDRLPDARYNRLQIRRHIEVVITRRS